MDASYDAASPHSPLNVRRLLVSPSAAGVSGLSTPFPGQVADWFSGGDVSVTEDIGDDPRGVIVRFPRVEDCMVMSTPSWSFAGWKVSFLAMGRHARLAFKPTAGLQHFFKCMKGKVVVGCCGQPRRFLGPVFSVPFGTRTCAVVDGEDVVAGPQGAVLMEMVETPEAPAQITDMEQISRVEGPFQDRFFWKRVDTYEWGKAFAGVPFFNLRGWRVENEDGSLLCYIQAWTCGKGVNCGMHNHSETHGDDAFCEVHACLYNGSGQGGMAYCDERDKLRWVPLLRGEEHGPFWSFDVSGMPIRRSDGSTVYPLHRWQGGGRTVTEASQQRFDVWFAFELPCAGSQVHDLDWDILEPW